MKIEIEIGYAVILLQETNRSVNLQQCLSRKPYDEALDPARAAANHLSQAIKDYDPVLVNQSL